MFGRWKRRNLLSWQRSYLPVLTDEELQLFARTFHGYSLLIVHAATLLAYRQGSVVQFCNDIRSRARLLFFNDTYTDDGKTLTVVLAAILEIVAYRKSGIAAEIISFISHLDGRLIFPQFIFLYLRAGRMLAVSQVEIDLAMMQLARFRLIDAAYSASHPHSVNFVYAHPLVSNIIRPMSEISLGVTRAAFLNVRLRLGQHAHWCEQTGKTIRPSLILLYIFVSAVPMVWDSETCSTMDLYASIIRDAYMLHADHLPSLFLEMVARTLSERTGAGSSLNSVLNLAAYGLVNDQEGGKVLWFIGEAHDRLSKSTGMASPVHLQNPAARLGSTAQLM